MTQWIASLGRSILEGYLYAWGTRRSHQLIQARWKWCQQLSDKPIFCCLILVISRKYYRIYTLSILSQQVQISFYPWSNMWNSCPIIQSLPLEHLARSYSLMRWILTLRYTIQSPHHYTFWNWNSHFGSISLPWVNQSRTKLVRLIYNYYNFPFCLRKQPCQE